MKGDFDTLLANESDTTLFGEFYTSHSTIFTRKRHELPI